MAKQPKMTLAQARTILQGRARSARSHARKSTSWVGLLGALFGAAALNHGTDVARDVFDWNLLRADPKRYATRWLFLFTGYNTDTGGWDPWIAVRSYVGAYVGMRLTTALAKRIAPGGRLRLPLIGTIRVW